MAAMITQREALTAGSAQECGWRPIETGPLDGTEVLLWREDCGQFIGSYTSADAFPLTQVEIDATAEEVLFAKDWFTQWPDARRLDGSETPTHWRPLPPPPGTAEPAPTPEWMTCATRAPWVANSLRSRAQELRTAEKRSRGAFRKDFMGVPARYFADAMSDAAAAVEARLQTIEAARVFQAQNPIPLAEGSTPKECRLEA